MSCPGAHFSIYLTHGTGVIQHHTAVGAVRPLLPLWLLLHLRTDDTPMLGAFVLTGYGARAHLLRAIFFVITKWQKLNGKIFHDYHPSTYFLLSYHCLQPYCTQPHYLWVPIGSVFYTVKACWTSNNYLFKFYMISNNFICRMRVVLYWLHPIRNLTHAPHFVALHNRKFFQLLLQHAAISAPRPQ